MLRFGAVLAKPVLARPPLSMVGMRSTFVSQVNSRRSAHTVRPLSEGQQALLQWDPAQGPAVTSHSLCPVHALAVRAQPQRQKEPSAAPTPTTATSGPKAATHYALPLHVERRKTAALKNAASAIERAYRLYYTHIRFRNGWETPAYPEKSDLVAGIFAEAADICARIRARLDVEVPGSKLRQTDGNAQAFLHSKEAHALFATVVADERKRRRFIRALVHATFRDAVGYVEGLTEGRVDEMFLLISAYSFDPTEYSRHLLLEMLSLAETAKLTFEAGYVTPQATTGGKEADCPHALVDRDNEHFCADGSDEDRLWRAAIGKLCEAHTALSEAFNARMAAVADTHKKQHATSPGTNDKTSPHAEIPEAEVLNETVDK